MSSYGKSRLIGELGRAAELVGVYPQLRRVYHKLVNRREYEFRRQLIEFFANFVSPGSLVFDIGANAGDYTGMYLELGADVVAVEPSPALARTIKRRYPAAVVIPAAVASQGGSGVLHLNEHGTESTLSATWIERTSGWTGETVAVELVTLDDLVARYGKPRFIKVDVEGYEDQALEGLGVAVDAVSIEYQCRALDVTERALGTLSSLGQYEFNYTLNLPYGRPPAFELAEWCTAGQVLSALARIGGTDELMYGDVYARSNHGR